MDFVVCRIAIPIFAVFAVRPCSSAVIPPVLKNSYSTAMSQMSALEENLLVEIWRSCGQSSSSPSVPEFPEFPGFPGYPG